MPLEEGYLNSRALEHNHRLEQAFLLCPYRSGIIVLPSTAVSFKGFEIVAQTRCELFKRGVPQRQLTNHPAPRPQMLEISMCACTGVHVSVCLSVSALKCTQAVLELLEFQLEPLDCASVLLSLQ